MGASPFLRKRFFLDFLRFLDHLLRLEPAGDTHQSLLDLPILRFLELLLLKFDSLPPNLLLEDKTLGHSVLLKELSLGGGWCLLQLVSNIVVAQFDLLVFV